MNRFAARFIVHTEVLDPQQLGTSPRGGASRRFGPNGCRHTAPPFFLADNKRLRNGRSTRRRGFASSSIPKLMNAKPAQSRATHNPAGTNSHHFPYKSAVLLCAEYKI